MLAWAHPSRRPKPVTNPSTAKVGTATAGLHNIGQPPPAALSPRLISAPTPPRIRALRIGRLSHLKDLAIAGLPSGILVGLLFGLAGPASTRHSGGYPEPGEHHRLKEDPNHQD